MSGGREGSGHPGTAVGTRLMLFRARGCLLAVALEAVEGVFDLVLEADGDRACLPEGGSVALVDWSSLSGVPIAEADVAPTEVAVVATSEGLVGLPIERCLGARRVSLTASAPTPTLLVDDRGSPACLLLRIEGKPVFLIEPRAFGGAVHLAAADTTAESRTANVTAEGDLALAGIGG